MKYNHIFSMVILCALASLALHSNLMSMDDEPWVTAELEFAQTKQIYRAQTVDELNQIIGEITNPVLLAEALLILVENSWNSSSALKINYLLKQIFTLDPDASLVRFENAQVDIMGSLILGHKPASAGSANTDLPDWIAWFVQRGVAVDALSNENSVYQVGYTPLCCAVFCKRLDVVRRLLELGAQASTVNRPRGEKPFTVLERYTDSTDPEIIPIINLLKTYLPLADTAADTSVRGSNSTPPAPIDAANITDTIPTAVTVSITSPAVSTTATPTISTLTTDILPPPVMTAAPQKIVMSQASTLIAPVEDLTQTTPAAEISTSIILPQPDDTTMPVVVTPAQPQPHTVTTMLRPQSLCIAGGIVLAMYAGYRWLRKEQAEIEDDEAQNEISENSAE